MKNSFLMYYEYEEHLDLLSDSQLRLLMKAIFAYEKTGQTLELDGMTKMAFSFIKAQLDRDNEKWDEKTKNKSNAGKKGMENRWKNKGNKSDIDDKSDDKENNKDILKDNKDNRNNSVINDITKITNITDNVDVKVDVKAKEDKEKEIKNINIFNKEKKAENKNKADTCEKEAKPPDIQADIQKSEDIQDMPQQVGLVAKNDQHKSIAGYSHGLKKKSQYAKYYKDFQHKKQYAEFVFMKEQEYEALLVKYGDYVVLEAIEKLNIWKLEKLAKRCLKDIRGDDYRKMLSWTVNAVIETMKKIDYKKYQEYMENFEKQNDPELRMKVLKLVAAKELDIKNVKNYSVENINDMYEFWMKHQKKKQKHIEEEANIGEY